MIFECRDTKLWRNWFAWRPVSLYDREKKRWALVWLEWVQWHPLEDWWLTNWCYAYKRGASEYVGGYIPEG
jgi:hypothetical protein